MICGAGRNDAKCGIDVEKNLFTPRLGIAYRPTEDLVIRAGYSRNPQSNNPGRQQMAPSQAFPQTIVITQDAPNNCHGGRQSLATAPDRAPGGSDLRCAGAAAGAGVNTYQDGYVRGKISSWNVTAQKALGSRMSVQVGYVANRQNGMMRNLNVNYGTDRRRRGEPAVPAARASRRR